MSKKQNGTLETICSLLENNKVFVVIYIPDLRMRHKNTNEDLDSSDNVEVYLNIDYKFLDVDNLPVSDLVSLINDVYHGNKIDENAKFVEYIYYPRRMEEKNE